MDPRQAYEKKGSAELDLLGAGLERLQARAQNAKAGAEIGHQRQLAELKAKRKAAQEYLSRLNRAGKFAWGELQVGADRAVSELRSALDQAATHLK
jgi:RNA-splicing ligase RtcB